VSPHRDPDLAARLDALRTAARLLRDPLADPALILGETGPHGAAFRALPRPRAGSRGSAARPPNTRLVATVPDVVQQPASPADGTGGSDEPDETIKSLVALAQAGDADAFGELYDRYVDLVYRYVYYRVGSQALAEDLTSEAFLRALRRITSFTWQGRDIGAWFITIARNLVADHFKSGRYRLEVATADMLDADRAEEGPESAVLDTLTNATLLEAVKQLGAEQQECVVLRFLQGLSVAETALAMGKNEGAIKALQYRAVRALGRLLPQDLL
jgi:RNA polymerase sigma-70 factor (ECF subfamily)